MMLSSHSAIVPWRPSGSGNVYAGIAVVHLLLSTGQVELQSCQGERTSDICP